MTFNFNWKQILIVACNVLVGIYLVLAVTAFNNPDEAMAKQCTEVKIDIEKESMEGFLNLGEVKKLLSQHKLYPLSQPMSSISPRKMEETLELGVDVVWTAKKYDVVANAWHHLKSLVGQYVKLHSLITPETVADNLVGNLR